MSNNTVKNMPTQNTSTVKNMPTQNNNINKQQIIDKVLDEEKFEAEEKEKALKDISDSGSKKTAVVLGIILVIIGAFFLIWHFVLEKYVNSSANNSQDFLNCSESKDTGCKGSGGG